jgi:hypothetical protein
MALKIIGSGLGRTGTKSLQTALNILGFGPCHHMAEVFTHPESLPLWIEAGARRPRWDAIFAGYRSAVDYPSAAHWRELAAYYPEAKVLHTVRDPDEWFDSTQATIFARTGAAVRTMEAGASVQGEFFKSFTGPLQAMAGGRFALFSACKCRMSPTLQRIAAPNSSAGLLPS